ncbi:hypothetical protein ACFSF0_09645 [Ottowia flava]|uniref:Uncharacterized protein n=1 Tax=Ottowia flava TaxID=2675430 RepID=A0ABW4KS43_9BURK|nr:hypothetical protein [Ottowia sp. GY511]
MLLIAALAGLQHHETHRNEWSPWSVRTALRQQAGVKAYQSEKYWTPPSGKP